MDRDPLIVLMPNDHRLTARQSVRPHDLVGETFIGGSNKATVLRAVTVTISAAPGSISIPSSMCAARGSLIMASAFLAAGWPGGEEGSVLASSFAADGCAASASWPTGSV